MRKFVKHPIIAATSVYRDFEKLLVNLSDKAQDKAYRYLAKTCEKAGVDHYAKPSDKCFKELPKEYQEEVIDFIKKLPPKAPKRSAAGKPVELEVCYDKYERYKGGSLHRFKVKGENLLDALRNMTDRMRLYINSDDIEEREMKPREIIDEIESCNGDGCDYIYYIKNVATGKKLLDGGEPEGYEEEYED